MPELPEVEAIRLGLENEILNKNMISISFNYPRLADSNSLDFELLKGERFIELSRIGKYLTLHTMNYKLIIHLGMSVLVSFALITLLSLAKPILVKL